MSGRPAARAQDDAAWLKELQRHTFAYFLYETNPANGLVPDSTRYGSASSIAAVGLALTVYPVAVEHGWLTREEGIARTLATLRFFRESPQGPGVDATGYRGFYYHFLDMKTGRRAHGCELSTVDTAILLSGVLAVCSYFTLPAAREREIRRIGNLLYRRADWRWALNGGAAVEQGWLPETGFLSWRYDGYDEALILYVLGLGSPTHPLPKTSYAAWAATFQWKEIYGSEMLYAGPLFIHQLPQIWLDLRGIRDGFMRGKGIDYFENSRRATYAQQQYAIRNPHKFVGYGRLGWGITAGDGPGEAVRRIRGIRRRFFGYVDRGIPYGPDDGTLSPWAVAASLPFAPEIVLPTLRSFERKYPKVRSDYGFFCSLNPTFPGGAGDRGGWIAKGYLGLDQGPIVAMIENSNSGLIWRLMKRCPYIQTGLRRAGFTGGWLD
jgi:hypothetical protein